MQLSSPTRGDLEKWCASWYTTYRTSPYFVQWWTSQFLALKGKKRKKYLSLYSKIQMVLFCIQSYCNVSKSLKRVLLHNYVVGSYLVFLNIVKLYKIRLSDDAHQARSHVLFWPNKSYMNANESRFKCNTHKIPQKWNVLPLLLTVDLNISLFWIDTLFIILKKNAHSSKILSRPFLLAILVQ